MHLICVLSNLLVSVRLLQPLLILKLQIFIILVCVLFQVMLHDGPEPIMLEILPIILSRISQNFSSIILMCFAYYSKIILIYF